MTLYMNLYYFKINECEYVSVWGYSRADALKKLKMYLPNKSIVEVLYDKPKGVLFDNHY